ncbi:MAG: hypothetical protein AAFY38_17105 [Pseudomonadota bacterium]
MTTERQAFEAGKTMLAILRAYWKTPDLFGPTANACFMLITQRTVGELKREVVLNGNEIAAYCGRKPSVVSASLRELMEAGVVMRRRVRFDGLHWGYSYRINRRAVLKLSE